MARSAITKYIILPLVATGIYLPNDNDNDDDI